MSLLVSLLNFVGPEGPPLELREEVTDSFELPAGRFARILMLRGVQPAHQLNIVQDPADLVLGDGSFDGDRVLRADVIEELYLDLSGRQHLTSEASVAAFSVHKLIPFLVNLVLNRFTAEIESSVLGIGMLALHARKTSISAIHQK